MLQPRHLQWEKKSNTWQHLMKVGERNVPAGIKEKNKRKYRPV